MARVVVPHAAAGSERTAGPRLALAVLALGVAVVLAIAWPALAPHDPIEPNVGPALAAPSLDFPFGTDQFGRDVLSRVIAGARLSLFVALTATLVAALAGGALGALAASLPRRPAEIVMRALDVVLAFPGILLAIVLAAGLGAGTLTTIVVLAVVYTPAFARLVRGAVLAELEQDYVAAARLLGTSRFRILGYHVGVNVVVPTVLFATTIVADAIVLEAALSFIGVGISPPTASWGNVIADGRDFIASGQWWISMFGGLAVFLSVLSLNALAGVLNRRLTEGADVR